jgi:hypothetical protein
MSLNTPFTPYDPFTFDVDIDDYMSRGGNLDVQKNGEYLVSYCLKRLHSGKKLCHRNEFFFIQDDPLCHHASVQRTLLDKWDYLSTNFIKPDVFADKFFLQLDMSFIHTTNQFDGIERKDLNWLQMGCYLDWNLLFQGQHYIPQFDEHILYRDYYDNTIWHHFAHKCQNYQPMDKVYQMLSLLSHYYPDGVSQANIMGDTPVDCLDDYYRNQLKKYSQIDDTEKEFHEDFLNYLQDVIFNLNKLKLNQKLSNELVDEPSEPSPVKIKI